MQRPRTVGELLDTCMKYYWSRKSEGTRRTYGTSITILKEHVGDSLIGRLKAPRINQMREELLKGRAPGTVTKILAVLRKAYNWAREMGWIDMVPVVKSAGTTRKRIRWVTDHEFALLLGFIRDPDYMDFVEILGLTGLRVSELRAIHQEDIDHEGKNLLVRNGKGGKTRTVPLTARAYQVLTSHRRRWQKIFKQITTTELQRQWAYARERLGLQDDPDFVPHALRHRAASIMAQRGVPLPVIQQVLGHSSITTTMRYSHLCPENLEVARKALS